ncbi:DUF3939 domain-containing protein [Paenibacillus alkaliterrae]|uniref:DUF3939 domain-containing protein n=1 Tax=Paenibacillus alkaliterrae TaxID=320909 RepID=UPI001F2579BD|nr:DUF3939 domain-containing protein [Paenibacillus alkaliterrae]MCF2937598.1 DUF3939 domain-containing protein [Paenibacillus alkaliterrae]
MNRIHTLALRLRIRHTPALMAMLFIIISLTGCMYPQDELKQNQAPPKEAVRNVQAAIDQYMSETGMLPIKNSTAETPVYEKFHVDFAKLGREGYLTGIPSAAFENGGNYHFLVIDEETAPRIKLLDIVTFQKINDIQSWVTAYIQSNGNLPSGEQMYPGFYQIDYKRLNKSEPAIRSIFSGQTIQAIVDENGVVFADYGIDIMQFIQKSGKSDFDAQFDLRTLLVDGSDFVPVKAPIYHWVNKEPQAAQP